MSERRFKDQISDALSEVLPDASGGVLEKWLAPTTESRIEQIPVEQIRDRAWRADVDTTEPNYRALKASIRASARPNRRSWLASWCMRGWRRSRQLRSSPLHRCAMGRLSLPLSSPRVLWWPRRLTM